MTKRRGQHFLLSRQAKTLSLATVFRMTDEQAETAFKGVRWADTNGEPVCPLCGGLDAYDCRRPNGAPRYRCRACQKDFSITSGTLDARNHQAIRRRQRLRAAPAPMGRGAHLRLVRTQPTTVQGLRGNHRKLDGMA